MWIDDRHPIFRRGLISWLSGDGFTVVGESAGLEPRPEPASFQVLVFDGDGPALTRAIRAYPSRRLVALLTDPTEQSLTDAIEAGVAAILLRPSVTPRGLASSVRAAAHGKTSLPSELVPQLLDGASHRRSSARRAGLNERELQVLQLLADGGSTKDMAEELCYSERTVKNIVHDLLVKMNCRNRAHAVGLATRQGLI